MSMSDEPDVAGSTSTIIRHQMFLKGAIFENLLDRSPVIDFVEDVLGNTCHLISENAIFTRPGQGIDTWHVDEAVHFPRPSDVPLDPRIAVPCFVVQALYYLVDVDEAIGPTQFVPGSQRSGRKPDPELVYDGKGVVNVIARAGDCLLQNGQAWHRGATNQTYSPVVADTGNTLTVKVTATSSSGSGCFDPRVVAHAAWPSRPGYGVEMMSCPNVPAAPWSGTGPHPTVNDLLLSALIVAIGRWNAARS